MSKIQNGIILILLAFIVYIFFNPVKCIFLIKTNSMYPAIQTNDIVIIKKQEIYEKGDIVTFTDETGINVTHRIAEIVEDENTVKYVTKGDNNNVVDNEQISQNQILGKVILVMKIRKVLVTLVTFMILVLAIIGIGFYASQSSYGKYVSENEIKYTMEIKVPIVEVESFTEYEEVNKSVCEFVVKNYNKKGITQTNMMYSIKVPNENPCISFNLYNENGDEIDFTNNISEEFKIECSKKEEHKYRLEINYTVDNDLDVKEEVQNLDIKINSYQI